MAEVNSALKGLIDIGERKPTGPLSQWSSVFCLSVWPTLERASDSSGLEVRILRQERSTEKLSVQAKGTITIREFFVHWRGAIIPGM